MEKADSLLEPLLKRLGIRDGVRLARIRNDWENLFDKTLSLHMYPSGLSEGDLLLNVDSPIWMQQLTYYKREILKNLGAYGVRNVRFRIGKISLKKPPRVDTRKTEDLSSEDTFFIDGLISAIGDDGLKEAIKGAAEKSLKASKRQSQY